jgi:hypothetical protein
MEQQFPTNYTTEGVHKYQEDSLWSARPERGSLLAEKNIPKWNQPNPLWEERQLEEERLDRSRPITPMQQMTGAGSWNTDYLVEARRRINNLRQEGEFSTNGPVAKNPRRHQVHFQEDQPVTDRATQV